MGRRTKTPSRGSGLVEPSAELARIVGEGPLRRSELLPRVWAYIREHALQNDADRRMIDADPNLRRVFGGREQVSMFELLGLLSPHIRAVGQEPGG